MAFAKATSVKLRERRREGSGLPDARRSDQSDGDRVRRAECAKRLRPAWTFYIDKNGNIAAIDKAVKPATSAEDMIAKLGELNVAPRR